MRYLPTSEVAERLGCSHDTALRRIRDGELPAINISTGVRPRFRVTDVDLEAFLEARPWLVQESA